MLRQAAPVRCIGIGHLQARRDQTHDAERLVIPGYAKKAPPQLHRRGQFTSLLVSRMDGKRVIFGEHEHSAIRLLWSWSWARRRARHTVGLQASSTARKRA